MMPAMGIMMRPVPVHVRVRMRACARVDGRRTSAGIELHIDASIVTTAIAVMRMMRNGRHTARTACIATCITPCVAAALTTIATRHAVQMRDRPERGEALIIGVRPLDFFAIVDGTRRGGERRSEHTETQQAENRRGASKNLHPMSVAPVLF